MKLIDLLVQELPKRGGWIASAEAMAQDADGYVFTYVKPPIFNCGEWIDETDNNPSFFSGMGIFEHSDDFDSSVITREQYEAALAASQKVEWDGAGNPPAGCICEGLYDSERNEWCRVRIIGHDDGAVIARWLEGKKAYCLLDYSSPKGSFRPLRSEDDKKRETAVEAMNALWNLNSKMHCEAIYDAIKSGQIVIE